MVTLQGMCKRPSGASSTGPAPGTIVRWRLAQPIADLAEQAGAAGWKILGIIGNTDHLRKHGDHTPWSRGKRPGIIYAIDVAPPPGFQGWLIARCRQADYDTRWIDFLNIGNAQYSASGVRLSSSGDHHLHISVAKGHEDTHVTLFSDYAGAGQDDDMDAKEFAALLRDPAVRTELANIVKDARFGFGSGVDGKGWTVGGALKTIIEAMPGPGPKK